MKSPLEETMLAQIQAHKLDDGMHREYHFASIAVGLGSGIRQRLKDADMHDWRFDFAWPDKQLAVEVEGGIWNGGRHVTGAGFEADCDKYNKATLMGWRILRFTNTSIKSGVAVQCIGIALAQTWTTAWEINV